VRSVIIAIDPGKMSGGAVYRLNDQDGQPFSSWQCDFDELCKHMIEMGAAHRDNLDVVSESFIITINTAKNTQATWSLELIGVARMVSRLYTGQELVLQTPAAAKRLCSDDLLKALGWYKPGQGHANDAARHLGLFLLSRGWMDPRIKKYMSGR